jgi:hypothetical protein
MQLTVELPNDLTLHADPAREALEAFAREAFRTQTLPRQQVARMLGLGRIAFNDWLKANDFTDDFYNADDLRDDIRTLDELEAAGYFAQ